MSTTATAGNPCSGERGYDRAPPSPNLHALHFSEATGILDWYHAAEHVWAAAHSLFPEHAAATSWADQALAVMRDEGGAGLFEWLKGQLAGRRGTRRKAVQSEITYVQTKQHLMDCL